MKDKLRAYNSVNSKYVSVFVWGLSLLFFLAGCKKEDEPVDVPFERLREKQTMYSSIFQNDITYAVLLPDGYDQSTDSYPVVYLLHGYGDDERAWYTSGGLRYYVDQYAGEIGPMIFVMPAAYYSYYVNKFSGDYPYMDMMTTELVPTIDSLFRTRKDKTARAVMGYSMGGYGALILPALNPDVFTVGVPLSMSFRTDEQYMAEPQNVFNSQWGNLFGGFGETGSARLTDHFILHSPFHFFKTGDLSRFDGLKLLVDCGDNEESLSITSDEMHAVMRDNGIEHEYRVRNGGHSFDYWKKSYPEAFKFIHNAFEGIPHPAEPIPVTIGALIDDTAIESMDVSGLSLNILTPIDYSTSTTIYPVLYLMHDYETGLRTQNVKDVFSLLRNNMESGKLTKSIVVEIPADGIFVSNQTIHDIVLAIDATYRTNNSKDGRIIAGNEKGGEIASYFVSANSEVFSSCFLFNATLTDEPSSASGEVFYYLDQTEECTGYRGYQQLYADIRREEFAYEYRVRQGTQNYQAFLNGLGESLASIKQSLTN